MQPLQADFAGASRGGLEGQGVDLRRGQQSMGVEQAQDLPRLGPDGNRQHEDWERQGVAGMVQTLDLLGLGPYGNRQAEAW